MRFYALQVTCETCKSAFLVGGANQNDLDIWKDAVVECSQCRAVCRARDGQVVGLTSPRSEFDTLQLADQLTPV